MIKFSAFFAGLHQVDTNKAFLHCSKGRHSVFIAFIISTYTGFKNPTVQYSCMFLNLFKERSHTVRFIKFKEFTFPHQFSTEGIEKHFIRTSHACEANMCILSLEKWAHVVQRILKNFFKSLSLYNQLSPRVTHTVKQKTLQHFHQKCLHNCTKTGVKYTQGSDMEVLELYLPKNYI